MDVLARADPAASPPADAVAAWTAEEWSERLDVVAPLPVEPRPALVALFALGTPPRSAMPAVVRVAIAHAADERDPLVRLAAGRLRAHRGSPEESVGLFDWEAGLARPELFLWLLELSGDAGTRPALVAAAAIPAGDAERLAAPLERPAWADGDVPWELDGVADAGEVRLPDGRLTGGDAWWTGGAEGFPWAIEVPPGTYPVRIATASHPLEGRDCAALELLLDAGTAAERWSLVGTYRVEVGAASLGAPDAVRQVAAGRLPAAATSGLGDRGRVDRALQRPAAAPALPDVGRDGGGPARRRRHRPRPARARPLARAVAPVAVAQPTTAGTSTRCASSTSRFE